MAERLKAQILGHKVEQIPLDGGRVQPKIVFMVKTTKNHQFEVSVAEVATEKGTNFQGLWLNVDGAGKVAKNSTLNLLLQHFGATTLEELQEKTVTLRPDPQGYYAITTVV